MEKFKVWLNSTGLTNFGYLAGCVVSTFLGFKVVAGACLGIFVYINWNIIRKLISNKL